jgi:hypothetical protein
MSTSNLNDLFQKDAEALQIKDDDIQGVAALASRAKSLSKEIDDLEKTLSEKKENYRKLAEESLPEALATLGMSSFRMADGSSIEIKPFYGASIKAERQAEAFAWLREHGFDDLIKNTVSVRFGKGEDELCNRLLTNLKGTGFMPEQAQKVEPMTLKAWVKEQVERGKDFPLELFGAYIGKKAIIKS